MGQRAWRKHVRKHADEVAQEEGVRDAILFAKRDYIVAELLVLHGKDELNQLLLDLTSRADG